MRDIIVTGSQVSLFVNVSKRNRTIQKNFWATQLWIAIHRLRTMAVDYDEKTYAQGFAILITVNEYLRKDIIK